MSDTQEEIFTRRPLRDRPQREVHRDPDPIMVIEEPDEVRPEDAAADVRRQLQERDEQLKQERALRQQAQQGRAAAEAQAQQAVRTQQADKQTVLAQAIETAKAEKTAAMAAYKLAREANDLESEMAANEMLQSASTRLELAQREMEWVKQQPQAPAPQPQQQQRGPSPEAQRWINEHPAYNVDKKYKALANLAHTEALQAGHPDGSQSYIDYIESYLTHELGEGHGQIGFQPERQERQLGDRGTAPPSRRASGGGTAGMKKVDLGNLGTIEYQQLEGGNKRIKMSREQREMFDEFAKVSFPQQYARDPDRTLQEYIQEHIDYALEDSDQKLVNGRLIRTDGGVS